MEAIFDSKKLELIYQNVGENNARRQSLNNVSQEATADSMASFATLMGQLAPKDESLKTVMVVEKQRIDI